MIGYRGVASMAASLVVAMTAAGAALQLMVPGFLGHLGGNALYLRTLYIPFGFLSLAIGEGLTVAAQVTVSAAYRHGRIATAGGPLTAMAVLGAGVFLALSVAVWCASEPLNRLLHVPADSRAELRWFLPAMLVANGVTLLPALAGAVLRGLGRARESAWAAVAQTVLIAGAVLGVQALWRFGALSVPIGFVAGALPIGVVLWVLVRRTGIRIAPYPTWLPVLAPLRRVALPIAASFLVLSASSLGYLWLLRNTDPAEVTGFGLVQSIQAFLVVPAIAIGSAAAITTVLAGPQAGADGLRVLVRITVPAYLVIGCAVVALRAPLVHVLTTDAAVRTAATGYLAVIGPSYLLFGLALAVLTYLEQTGHATGALVVNVLFFGAVFVVAAALGQPLAASTLILLIAIANIPDCAGVLLYARMAQRRGSA